MLRAKYISPISVRSDPVRLIMLGTGDRNVDLDRFEMLGVFMTLVDRSGLTPSVSFMGRNSGHSREAVVSIVSFRRESIVPRRPPFPERG